MEKNSLSLGGMLTVEDIVNGEVGIPNSLFFFLSHLICGHDKRKHSNESKTPRVKSLCQDIILSTTSGKKKSAKNIMLGMAMKSLIGSRKVIDILNRLGH